MAAVRSRGGTEPRAQGWLIITLLRIQSPDALWYHSRSPGRPPTMNEPTGWSDPDARAWSRLTFALVAVIGLIGLLTFRDYGLSWDQAVSRDYGELILRWYISGFQDRRALDYLDRSVYGGLFDVVAQTLVHLARSPEFETRALVSLCAGLVGLAYTGRLASRLAGRRAGFLASCLLALTPSYYGHMFVNARDIPLAAAFIATLYYGFEGAHALRGGRIPVSLSAKMGVALGLAMALRIQALLLYGYLVATVAWVLIEETRDAGQLDTRRLRHAVLALIGVLALAWLIMLPFWPLAQVSPIAALDALRGSPFEPPSPARFGGSQVAMANLPRSYVAVWFAITLPEAYFLVAALFVLRFVGDRGAVRQRSWRMVCLIAVFAALPLVVVTWKRAPFYDGVRHLLFVVPMLAVLSAAAFSWTVDGFARPWVRRASWVALSLVLIGVLPDMVALHPYQSVYFNRLFAGGLARAGRLYETDYWGQSYREAVLWLADHYPAQAARPVGVENCSNPLLSAYYIDHDPRLRGRFVAARKGEGRIVLATTRFDCHLQPGKVLHVVAREGVPLAYVIERTPEVP